MYPNQKIAGPFGSIYTVNTPYIDQFANRAYKEEQQQKQQQDKDAKAMDDGFAKELANVKSVDVPEIVNLYNNYKNTSKGVIKKGANATTQDNQDLLLKKAALYKGINASVEDKKYWQNHAAAIKTDKKGLYATDASQQVLKGMNTPTSKRNMDDDVNLFHQYAVPDLDKEIKIARGTPTDVVIPVGQNKLDPLKDDKEVYKVGNHPNKFYDSLFSDLVRNNKGQNFAGIMDNQYTDQEKEDLTNKYIEKIHDPNFIKVYGQVQPFPAVAMQTKLGEAVALKTMEEVINTDLKPSKLISETNASRKSANDFSIWRQKQPIKLANQKELMATRERYKDEKDEKITKDVSAFVDGEIEESAKDASYYANKPGKNFAPVTNRKIKTSPLTLSFFTQVDNAGNKYAPKGMYYNPEKNTFILQGGEQNGGDREISRDEYEAVLVNKMFNSKTKLNQINTNKTVADDKKTTRSSSSSSTKKITDPALLKLLNK